MLLDTGPLSIFAPIFDVHPGSSITFLAIYLPTLVEAFPMFLKRSSALMFLSSTIIDFFPISFRIVSNEHFSTSFGYISV